MNDERSRGSLDLTILGTRPGIGLLPALTSSTVEDERTTLMEPLINIDRS